MIGASTWLNFDTMKNAIIIFCHFVFYCTSFSVQAQSSKKLISGPWAGNVELRTATVWLEVSKQVKKVHLTYTSKGSEKATKVAYRGNLERDFNPVKIDLVGLDFNTNYEYDIWVDDEKIELPFATKFTTKDLWQFRKPAPDFSFLAGSCNYSNEVIYDRPGKSYGGDSSIYETMAATPAQFNLWLGDNWYYREVDFSSVWGLQYRASHDRSKSALQSLMASMPQYAIWDDHDFGPNDANQSFIFKQNSRSIFNDYFLNPTCGQDGRGIYTQFSYSDADFFLTDNRYFRSHENFEDSVDGKPNNKKNYFGEQQMEWLKNALLSSKATFKFIVSGNQVLNQLNPFESMQHYSFEYNNLLQFLKTHKINGVIFLSGDRHHGEVIRLNREGSYPLYDITLSPLTSGIAKPHVSELNNPQRIESTLVEEQHFGKISISGPKNERAVTLAFVGKKGQVISSWKINQKEITNH
jgi:alkaline phosphatase D